MQTKEQEIGRHFLNKVYLSMDFTAFPLSEIPFSLPADAQCVGMNIVWFKHSILAITDTTPTTTLRYTKGLYSLGRQQHIMLITVSSQSSVVGFNVQL